MCLIKRAVLGIEPRTSRTLSENHATRPNSQLPKFARFLFITVFPFPFAFLFLFQQSAWHSSAILRHCAAQQQSPSHSNIPKTRRPARPSIAPFPTPATRNARCAHASPRRPTRIHVRDTSGSHLDPHLPRETHAQQRPNARFPHTCHADPPSTAVPSASMHPKPHTCHAKHTRTNVQMHASPHLPRGSTGQCLPELLNASKRTSTFPARRTPRPQSAWHGINDAPATTPREHRRRHTANEANTGPAARPPDYKREPFATHSGKNRL